MNSQNKGLSIVTLLLFYLNFVLIVASLSLVAYDFYKFMQPGLAFVTGTLVLFWLLLAAYLFRHGISWSGMKSFPKNIRLALFGTQLPLFLITAYMLYYEINSVLLK
ncbi:hypothetical protein [Eupransor demetentiae]|uniref:Uncharacterized protein n=1 Tax=Eupransor demetentiae TaxID=3109584 RepID=A0ABM9N5E2_9LACO|nr:hypothetical protein R54876_GBNLAHCA_00965 [Lactobacillaceae bacterium LMG 33000]